MRVCRSDRRYRQWRLHSGNLWPLLALIIGWFYVFVGKRRDAEFLVLVLLDIDGYMIGTVGCVFCCSGGLYR